MNLETTRLAAAVGLTLAYAGLCWWAWRGHRRRTGRLGANGAAASSSSTAWLVAYASQTGHAEELAQQAVQALSAGGAAVQLARLDDVDARALAATRQALFIVSTTGEGDPPDEACRFATQVLTQGHELSARPPLRYGLLALGDATYTHYCGFGRQLDAWLARCGAQALFPRIEVDRAAPAALVAWRQQLARLGGQASAGSDDAAGFGDWRLVARETLNPGSSAAPLVRLDFVPAAGELPAWQSGDIAQLQPPQPEAGPRDYSIASIPADGRLQLMVRLHRRPDGGTGLCSGWLTQQLAPGDRVRLRVQAHERFRLQHKLQRPLILVGAGSGLAGLLGHLRQRVAEGMGDNWLLFGERQAAHDALCTNEIAAWQAGGLLARVDRVYSRDGAALRYVQDVLYAQAAELRDWIARGAAVYVCGSRAGMGTAVDTALIEILGSEDRDALERAGRYRRDLY